MSEVQDRKAIKDAEAILDELFDKYAEASPAGQWLLKPAIEKASEELLHARLALFKDGVLTTPKDVEELEEIKKAIDSAADTQAFIMVALRLAAFLGAFV